VPSTQPATIYLTGGSSSIPLVHSRLAELGPLGVLGDPKTVVVQGALYTPQAAPAPQQATVPPVAPPTSAPTPMQQGGVVPTTAGNTGAMPVSAPMAQFTGGPPPYPPPNMASGPLPLQHPGGGTAANPMKKWVIVGAGVAAAVIALVVVLVATGVFSSGSSPATPAASVSSSKASTTTASSADSSATASGTDTSAATPPMTADDYRLLKLLPSGYSPGACTPAKQRVTDALSTLECDENSEPGGPTSSQYSLFSDPAALAAHFQSTLNEDVVSNCPGDSESATTWHYQDTPNLTAGRVGCGTYQNNPDITWTKDDQLLLGEGQGPDINALHQWWAKYG
jgi:hypothetical protein